MSRLFDKFALLSQGKITGQQIEMEVSTISDLTTKQETRKVERLM